MPTLYLLRHGDAVPDQENLLRPLSDQGKEEVRQTANALSAHNPQIDKVIHSTKMRAKQSAQIFCETLGLDVPTEESPHILPMAEPEDMVESCNETSGGLLIVTHLPFVNRLASLLIGGKEDAEQFTFKTASLLYLTQRSGSDLLGSEGQWAVEHFISRP